jgi:hypothetical protein
MVSRNASEGFEPRNMTSRIGPRVSPSGSQQRCTRYGECISVVPGSQTIAGHSTVHSGTRESHVVPKEASDESKRRRRKYGGVAVGLTHTRGVDGVMAIESQEPGTLEGVSNRTQRDEYAYAIH